METGLGGRSWTQAGPLQKTAKEGKVRGVLKTQAWPLSLTQRLHLGRNPVPSEPRSLLLSEVDGDPYPAAMPGALNEITVEAHSLVLPLSLRFPLPGYGFTLEQQWRRLREVHLPLPLLGKQAKSLCLPVAEGAASAAASRNPQSARGFHTKSIKRRSARTPSAPRMTGLFFVNRVQMCRENDVPLRGRVGAQVTRLSHSLLPLPARSQALSSPIWSGEKHLRCYGVTTRPPRQHAEGGKSWVWSHLDDLGQVDKYPKPQFSRLLNERATPFLAQKFIHSKTEDGASAPDAGLGTRD